MVCWWKKISGKKKRKENSVQVNKSTFGWTQPSPSYTGAEVSRTVKPAVQAISHGNDAPMLALKVPPKNV